MSYKKFLNLITLNSIELKEKKLSTLTLYGLHDNTRRHCVLKECRRTDCYHFVTDFRKKKTGNYYYGNLGGQ